MPQIADPVPADPPVGPAGDDWFRAFFEANVGLVWRSLLGLGVASADVADASQQVFVVLNAKLPRWDRRASLRAFMYGVCLRVASDYRRRAHRRRERLSPDLPEVAFGGATPEETAASRQELRLLDAALLRLAPAQREVFILFEIEELDMTEVAEAVGCPLFTAYSRLRAARKAIDTHLRDLDGKALR